MKLQQRVNIIICFYQNSLARNVATIPSKYQTIIAVRLTVGFRAVNEKLKPFRIGLHDIIARR